MVADIPEQANQCPDRMVAPSLPSHLQTASSFLEIQQSKALFSEIHTSYFQSSVLKINPSNNSPFSPMEEPSLPTGTEHSLSQSRADVQEEKSLAPEQDPPHDGKSRRNPHEICDEHQPVATPNRRSIRNKHTASATNRARPDSPNNPQNPHPSPSTIAWVRGWFNPPNSQRDSSKSDQRPQRLAAGSQNNFVASSHTNNAQLAQQLLEAQREISDADLERGKLKQEAKHWQQSAETISRQFEAFGNESNDKISQLHSKIRELQHEKSSIQEEYNTTIRRQQEASFRQMESGRWVPVEENKVIGELDRLRRTMKSWAKAVAIKDMSRLEALQADEYNFLMGELSSVVVMSNNQLPSGLNTTKSAILLLNALVAHSMFTSFFRSPFFFLDDGFGIDSQETKLEEAFNEIYRRAQESNAPDAHLWRSHTMRLLLPPIGGNITDGEKALRTDTEGMIRKISERQASKFLSGPARHLINADILTNGLSEKIRSAYHEAAALSYKLWTRRTAMRLKSLYDLQHLPFNVDDIRLVPHPTVRYEEHEDQLEGKPITVIVHPLLEVYGTDEAEDYDKGRVWACAEVWLESK